MIDEIMNDEEETNDGEMGTVGDEEEKDEEDASTPEEEASTEEAM